MKSHLHHSLLATSHKKQEIGLKSNAKHAIGAENQPAQKRPRTSDSTTHESKALSDQGKPNGLSRAAAPARAGRSADSAIELSDDSDDDLDEPLVVRYGKGDKTKTKAKSPATAPIDLTNSLPRKIKRRVCLSFAHSHTTHASHDHKIARATRHRTHDTRRAHA